MLLLAFVRFGQSYPNFNDFMRFWRLPFQATPIAFVPIGVKPPEQFKRHRLPLANLTERTAHSYRVLLD